MGRVALLAPNVARMLRKKLGIQGETMAMEAPEEVRPVARTVAFRLADGIVAIAGAVGDEDAALQVDEVVDPLPRARRLLIAIPLGGLRTETA